MKEEIIKKLSDYVEATGDFLLEQCPLLVQEIVIYERAFGPFVALVGVVVVFFTVQWWKRISKKDARYDYWAQIKGFIIAELIVFGSILFLYGVNNTTKAWVAPRLLLMEKILR